MRRWSKDRKPPLISRQLRRGTEWIARFVINANERDVFSRDIMELRITLQPAVGVVIHAHDAAVGGGSLPEVEISIGPDHRAVGVMVAGAGEIFDQRGFVSRAIDLQDAPAAGFATLGDVEVPIMKRRAIPRPIAAASDDDDGIRGINADQARL